MFTSFASRWRGLHLLRLFIFYLLDCIVIFSLRLGLFLVWFWQVATIATHVKHLHGLLIVLFLIFLIFLIIRLVSIAPKERPIVSIVVIVVVIVVVFILDSPLHKPSVTICKLAVGRSRAIYLGISIDRGL